MTNPRDTHIPRLLSEKSSARLEQIAALRARGIGDHVALPQIVVCGDQSAGKSLLLQGLSGFSFPSQDGVCTKFATEIILEHSDGPLQIEATILPSRCRSDDRKAMLQAFRRDLAGFVELPVAIAEAGSLMGIRGFEGVVDGPAFAEDVLRVKVSGPTGLHLTVVDLPGLISVPSDEQTEEDMRTVHNLVDSYAENPRTIILAVVQAGNDIANQSIIQKSRRFDKEGKRTVGIITKPDLINEGSEKRIALLARNEDTTRLKLGFFIVKNPSPSEIAEGITLEEREKKELQFFSSTPWREQGLSDDRVGILPLRKFLQNLLDKHIERELPKVREEIQKLTINAEKDLYALGEERPTITHLRMYVTRLSTQFVGLVKAALDGHYHEADPDFFDDADEDTFICKRLRAVLHQLNLSFSNYMRENGQKRKIIRNPEEDDCDEEIAENGQVLVTETQMKSWVKQIYRSTRGKELPGNYNHVLLSELFHIQSSRWETIAKEHVSNVSDKITTFAKDALGHVVREEHILSELREILNNSLSDAKATAIEELHKICDDEKMQPITYNHYFTDTVQKARHDVTRNLIKTAMREANIEEFNGRMHISNNIVDAEKLLASLQRRVVVDMEEQTCIEALDGLNAYYKVSMKTFVDNVCRQVVERHLVRPLPRILNPEVVAAFSDEDLHRVAAEPQENVERRRQLRELFNNLQISLQELRK